MSGQNLQCSSAQSLTKSSRIPELPSASASEQHQSVNDNQGKMSNKHKGHFSLMELGRTEELQEEKWSPSSGRLARLHYFDETEQISVERTHSANMTSFHVFFLHIRLNKSCCHFRITDYIFS